MCSLMTVGTARRQGRSLPMRTGNFLMNSVVRKKLLMAYGDVNSTAAVALFFEAQTSKCAPGGQRSALWLLMKRSRIGRMGTVGIFVGVTLSVEPSAPSVAISRSGVVWGH